MMVTTIFFGSIENFNNFEETIGNFNGFEQTIELF